MRSLIYYKVKNRRLALDLSHFQLNFLCATRDIRTHTNHRHCVGGSTHAGLVHFLRKHCKTYRARGAEHRALATERDGWRRGQISNGTDAVHSHRRSNKETTSLDCWCFFLLRADGSMDYDPSACANFSPSSSERCKLLEYILTFHTQSHRRVPSRKLMLFVIAFRPFFHRYSHYHQWFDFAYGCLVPISAIIPVREAMQRDTIRAYDDTDAGCAREQRRRRRQ